MILFSGGDEKRDRPTLRTPGASLASAGRAGRAMRLRCTSPRHADTLHPQHPSPDTSRRPAEARPSCSLRRAHPPGTSLSLSLSLSLSRARVAVALLAAGLLLAFTPGQAVAQEQRLVSNTGQADRHGSGDSADLHIWDSAQGFRTGDDSRGYTVTSVELRFTYGGGNPRNTVSIWTRKSGNQPGSKVGGNLHRPSGFFSGDNRYTTSGIDLDADTNYYVVVDSTDDTGDLSWHDYRTTHTINCVGSPAKCDPQQYLEDPGGASGWDIDQYSIQRDWDSNGGWTRYNGVDQNGDPVRPSPPHIIRINGLVTGTAEILPSLSVADAGANEANGSIGFRVTLDPTADEAVTVDYETADGTAVAGSDYTATSGTLTFEPGDDAKTVRVPLIDDDVEDDGETFTLTLSNAAGATIADGMATGTILNTEALTASFQDVPASHNGDDLFSFQVAFSDDIDISYKEFRDFTLDIT